MLHLVAFIFLLINDILKTCPKDTSLNLYTHYTQLLNLLEIYSIIHHRHC